MTLEPSTRRDRLQSIFDENFSYVWRSLLRLGVRSGDAEDLAQDVFVIVSQRLDSYDAARPIRPWLFGITYNVVRDWRRLARHREVPLETDDGRDDARFAQLEAVQLLHAALGDVDETVRPILVLADFDETPMEEIAAALDIPVSTGYARLAQGREQLRAAVARRDSAGGRHG